MKKTILSLVALASLAFMSTGCAKPQLDARAEAGRPASAEVSLISIPYNPSMPKFVLVVEPFTTSSTVYSFTSGEAGQVPVGDKMAAQLITALSRVGNFVLYDSRSANKITLRKGEKGPFLVKATLTEFNENAEASEEDNGVSLGGVGAVLGIAGAVSSRPGLMWTGAGLAAANPTYENSQAERKGMVAFDVQLTEKGSGRIVGSFEASGTFKAQSAVSGMSLFGIGNRKAQFASSAIGQALRVAMNDAVQHTVDTLR
jgi:curli biogenesis system outer membrane secretion channel CsgG